MASLLTGSPILTSLDRSSSIFTASTQQSGSRLHNQKFEKNPLRVDTYCNFDLYESGRSSRRSKSGHIKHTCKIPFFTMNWKVGFLSIFSSHFSCLSVAERSLKARCPTNVDPEHRHDSGDMPLRVDTKDQPWA